MGSSLRSEASPGGSISKTSRAAPPTVPLRTAASRADAIDQLAARAVHNTDAILHLRKCFRVQHVIVSGVSATCKVM